MTKVRELIRQAHDVLNEAEREIPDLEDEMVVLRGVASDIDALGGVPADDISTVGGDLAKKIREVVNLIDEQMGR